MDNQERTSFKDEGNNALEYSNKSIKEYESKYYL